jgi:uncharacterized repeat protein (TIGR01451 family)
MDNWDFDNIWGIVEGVSYPYLRWQYVCTCGDICVNETGWWYNGGAFIASNTPIQHAIDNATAGDTICVKDGTYNDNVNVKSSNDPVFEITADYVNISGFTATGSTAHATDYTAGILGSDMDHCNISGNNCSNNNFGIWLDFSSNNMLTGNTANSNNGNGIWLCDSNNYNTLTSNTASNNYYGLVLQSHSSNTASNNNSSNNIIYNNYFNNTNNAYDDSNNVWNTTKTLGTNIIGGPYLGGNYWSDYAGRDLNGDGLGDTLLPYNSSGSITTGGDWHPLTTVGYAPPEIISFAPPSPVNDTVCNWRTFNVTVNQTVNVSGYLNSTLQHTNVSTKEASYTLHAEVVGEHNVSAIASNENGTDMQTWVWNVTAAPVPVLEINKTGVPDPVSPGGTLNYTISVNNTGNATATNVTVKETYDKNVTFVSAVHVPSQGNDTWQFPTLNVSETRWINVSVIVNASVPNGTVLHNFVNVTCDEGVTDTDTADTTVFVVPVCVETATGTGIACFATDSGTIEDLVAVDESTLPEEGKPKLVFPHGFFSFNLTGPCRRWIGRRRWHCKWRHCRSGRTRSASQQAQINKVRSHERCSWWYYYIYDIIRQCGSGSTNRCHVNRKLSGRRNVHLRCACS